MVRDTGTAGGRRDRRMAAAPVYLIMSGVFGLFFAMIATINMVYQFTVAGLSPLQLVLVGTLLETVAFLCEVPTGIVADLYSRRLSIVIGFFLVGAGFVLEGLVPTFAAILATQVIWGVGITFTSGATDAWIADEVGEEAAAPLYLRGTQASQFGALLGTFASVGLATIDLYVPILLGGALIIGLALFLALFMPERGFTPTPQPERNSFQKMGHTFVAGARVVRASAILLTILAVIVFRGAASEAYDRLSQPHFLANLAFPTLGGLDTIVWFGIISAAGRILTIGASAFVERRVDTTTSRGAARIVFLLNAAQLVAVVTFGLAVNFWAAVAAVLVIAICRSTIGPVLTAWINQSLEPGTRATVLSMTAQTDALGQIAGGPVLGWVGNAFSIRAALTTSGILLAPALLFLARAVGRRATGTDHRRDAEAQRAAEGDD
jgi:MFS transporter, DHA3 family, tetracycline resistance protein